MEDLSIASNFIKKNTDGGNNQQEVLFTILMWGVAIFIILLILFFNDSCSACIDSCIDTFVELIDPEDDDE